MSNEQFTSSVLDGRTVVSERLEEVVPIYQKAFQGEPWFEVSLCPADNQVEEKCKGGYSPLPVGAICRTCELVPVQEAYPSDEVARKFQKLAEIRPMQWYFEESQEGGIALAAFVTKCSPRTIAQEKYSDSTEMRSWITENLQSGDIGWLDEVFADRSVREKGNLSNFGGMVTKLAEGLGVGVVAYRTINPRMIHATERDFGDNATIYTPDDLPDHRYFVTISTKKEKL